MLLLSDAAARAQQEGGTWSDIFNRGSFVNKIPEVVWFLAAQLAFLLALPITLMVFRWLPDRGYFLGKIFGVLLAAYIPWLLASLHWLSFSRLSVLVGLLLLGLVSTAILRRRGREILDFLREKRRVIIVGEVLFLVAFAGMFAVRMWNPDLWDLYLGGEKADGLRLLQRRAEVDVHAAVRPLVRGRPTQLLLLRILYGRRLHQVHRHPALYRDHPHRSALLRADGVGGLLGRLQPRHARQAPPRRCRTRAAPAVPDRRGRDGRDLRHRARQPRWRRADRAGAGPRPTQPGLRQLRLLAQQPHAGARGRARPSPSSPSSPSSSPTRTPTCSSSR